MAKEEKKLKTVLFSERQLKMVQDIEEEKGTDNFSSAIHFCVHETWKKMFPAYARDKDEDEIVKKAVAKAKGKEEVAKLSSNKTERIGTEYCESIMGGKVIDGICHYKQFGPNKTHDSDESCKIFMLGDIVTQKDLFYPDQETVLKARPDLIKKLNIK